MFKIAKFIIFTLSLFLFSFSLLNIQASAQNPTSVYTVNASAGLNARDGNCNIITTIPNKTVVNDSRVYSGVTDKEITCTVKGKTYTMMPIRSLTITDSRSWFVAKNYLTPAVGKIPSDGASSAVLATAGLNLRDKNCNRIGTVPYKAVVQNNSQLDSGLIVCEVKGVRYAMEPIIYNGKSGYAANNWLS